MDVVHGHARHDAVATKARITEKHWDPDQPGQETHRVVSEGPDETELAQVRAEVL